MIHIRTDNWPDNSRREFACGITELPAGDKFFFASESSAYRLSDCPICNPRPEVLGVPASSMNGNAAQRHEDPGAWDRWVAFCNACGAP